jgi:hypothetical protein
LGAAPGRGRSDIVDPDVQRDERTTLSGHSDIAMQELYSTIRSDEMRTALIVAADAQIVGQPHDVGWHRAQ